MRAFGRSQGSFGRKTAVEDRTEVLPDQWWASYGTETPDLKRLQNRDKKKQNYDPINFETLGDHSDWVLEDSPPFLTIEEVEALRNDLANMAIQPLSNDIDQLILDEVDDAQPNSGDNMEQSNEVVDPFDDVAADFNEDPFDEGEPNIETTMPPWN
ncbi:hypothetical protein P8452_19762 [Trifolium repens]|nr:hypothetical protein P8452_19762 [Trifolium repens]